MSGLTTSWAPGIAPLHLICRNPRLARLDPGAGRLTLAYERQDPLRFPAIRPTPYALNPWGRVSNPPYFLYGGPRSGHIVLLPEFLGN